MTNGDRPPVLADTGLREEGTCAGCGVQGRLLADPLTPGCLWCRDCGGRGPEWVCIAPEEDR